MAIDMGFIERFMEINNNAQELSDEWHNEEQLTDDEKKVFQQDRDALFKGWCPYQNSFDRCEDRRCKCKEEQSSGE